MCGNDDAGWEEVNASAHIYARSRYLTISFRVLILVPFDTTCFSTKILPFQSQMAIWIEWLVLQIEACQLLLSEAHFEKSVKHQ